MAILILKLLTLIVITLNNETVNILTKRRPAATLLHYLSDHNIVYSPWLLLGSARLD